jgi:hypothetical protein
LPALITGLFLAHCFGESILIRAKDTSEKFNATSHMV